MAARTMRRPDGEAVRTERFLEFKPTFVGGQGDLLARVKRLELRQRHRLDIAANAAFGKAQRHPRFELRDDSGVHLRVIGEVLVEPRGPALHQRAQPRRALGILHFEIGRIDPQPLAQVRPDRAFAIGLGAAAKARQVIHLDPVEVILGLGIDHPVNRIGVSVALDVGDAPIVAANLGLIGHGGRGQGQRGHSECGGAVHDGSPCWGDSGTLAGEGKPIQVSFRICASGR